MKIRKVILVLAIIFLTVALIPAEAVFNSQGLVFTGTQLLSTGSDNNSASAKSWSEKKHPFVALSGAMGFNLLLSTWNRYMIGSAWAQTGWEQWDHFWKRELSWDRDWYWTNYFLHPYQGAMYYTASRSSNLNAAESMAITVLGSYTWEYLCECNAPSKNDMVYTTIGSFCVGEMFYRLSLEADNISRILGAAISPERMWTDYVWQIKKRPSTGNIHSLSVGINIGNQTAGTKVNNTPSADYKAQEIFPVYGGFLFDVDYNDPYSHDSNTPYSQFTLNVDGELGKGSGTAGPCAYDDIDEMIFYNIRIFSDAWLVSRTINSWESRDTTAGLVMIYDFDWNSYYMLSSLAPGLAVKQRVRGDNADTEWQIQVAGIVLGTTDYYYYHRNVGGQKPETGTIRTYSDTIGAETILKYKYVTNLNYSASLNFRGYAMYDFYDQLQVKDNETTGWEFIGILSGALEAPVSEKMRLGLSQELYGKATSYKSKEDLYQLVSNTKVYARLQLK